MCNQSVERSPKSHPEVRRYPLSLGALSVHSARVRGQVARQTKEQGMTSLADGVVAQQSGSSLAALRRFTELVLGELSDTQLANDQRSNFGTVFSSDTCDPDSPVRQPFGLVFQEGQRAAFNLPPRRRFVVEYVKISCWATDPHLLVQLTTQSRTMFRNMTLCSAYEDLSGICSVTPASPLLLWESTVNTLLFSDGGRRLSAAVPDDTCVQLWGYLEPTSFSGIPRCVRKT